MATQVLAALGADVIKVEGVRRPDGMRFAGGRPPSWDEWWEWGPVFQCSNTNKRGITLELSTPRGREVALDLIGRSDIVIENFSPRVLANFDLEWDVVHNAAPKVTMVRMPAFGLDGPWRDRVGFAQTMEQASGMAWMTGSTDGPPVIPRGLCDPLAGLHASFAAIAALEIRDRTGTGIHVESTMVEAALNVAAESVLEYTRNSVELRREGNRGPGASPQGVYRCRGDDEWVAVAIFDERAWLALAEVIGHSELAVDETLRDEWARRRRADEIDKLIEEWTMQHTPADIVATLRAQRVPAARVVSTADLLDDDQLTARGFWEMVDHPVIGTFKTTGMPFTFAGGQRKWVTRPAPLYGQHTDEVLSSVLGCTSADIASLEEVGAVGRRPAGL
jgi:crotonobetainyl-CoA:carnitine CoA-transferase CaiB-like acyl-CoA transferase